MPQEFKSDGQSSGIHGTRDISRSTTGKTTHLTLTGNGDIFYSNHRIGYINQNGELHGIGRNGFAVLICLVDHHREAIPALKEWWNTKR